MKEVQLDMQLVHIEISKPDLRNLILQTLHLTGSAATLSRP